MNLLIDTQAFIYWTMQPEELPARASDAIRSGNNVVYLTLVTPWEMQIKFALNHLKLREPPRQLIQSELDDGAFTLLPITLDHIAALSGLPHHHKDPFDRLLIAQAMHENLTIVTGDDEIAKYPVQTLWK